eukprot:scaffold65999_cov20-Tisochrysis_lutea.AAC.1
MHTRLHGLRPGRSIAQKSKHRAPQSRSSGPSSHAAHSSRSSSPAANGNPAGGGGASAKEEDYVTFEGGLRVLRALWGSLFGYQHTGVQWLWELYCQRTGGILGDEM